MADISDNQKEGLDDSDKAMEIDEVDEDDDNLSPNTSGTSTCNVGGSGDEGGRDELLLKLQQYVTLDTNFTRQRIGRILVETFRIAVNSGTKLNVNDIMQWVQQIIQDPDTQVRLDLMEQLPHVVTICQEASHLFGNVLHDHLLSIIIAFLQDQDNQVRMTTQAVVLTLMKNGLLDSTTIELKICPVIEVLCGSSVDFLQSGISLMSKMAPLIGKKLTEKIFLDRYIALCEDKDIYARKVCASHFGEICVAVGRKAFLRKLFPIFVDLCCDKAWGIRKACVDVMMPVACCMTLQQRQLLLSELLAMHLNDESKWVRMSAFQILGPFISTFAKQFTEVTYNQHGELVFTSQQDTRFSIRYSYEGNYPPKYVVRSHSFDPEDLDSKDNFNSPVIIQTISDDEEEEDESQENHVFALRAYKSKLQGKLNQNQSTDDVEKYNSFLYYYITPDLPLDESLVEAARRPPVKSESDWKPIVDTASSKAYSLNDVVEEEKFPEVELIPVNEEELVPLHLINVFLTMAEPERYSDIGADILHHCAFSFPAVALTLGREHWYYLQPTYKLLLNADQWKVRRTLASSIHEIATILGEELTATELIPVYDWFIKDVDEVRIGVLKHLAAFLKILKPTDRCLYLPRLKEFLVTDNEWNWRFREELATQLLEIVNLFGPTDVEEYIVPLSLDLLSDKVAAVRHVALSLVAQIVAHLSDNERLVTALFQELKFSLGVYAKKWIRRQTLAFVCAQLIAKNAISGHRFSKEMLPSLLKLSMDKVPNVRLAVARTLSKNVIPMGPNWLGVEQAEKVKKRLREMRSDPDRDVRVLAGGDENPVLDILSQTKAEQSRNILF